MWFICVKNLVSASATLFATFWFFFPYLEKIQIAKSFANSVGAKKEAILCVKLDICFLTTTRQ